MVGGVPGQFLSAHGAHETVVSGIVVTRTQFYFQIQVTGQQYLVSDPQPSADEPALIAGVLKPGERQVPDIECSSVHIGGNEPSEEFLARPVSKLRFTHKDFPLGVILECPGIIGCREICRPLGRQAPFHSDVKGQQRDFCQPCLQCDILGICDAARYDKSIYQDKQ